MTHTPTLLSLLFIFRRGPYQNSQGNAGVDLLLTAASFDQRISVAFLEDGVYHLLDGQDSSGIGLKNLSQVFPALELYEINDIMVDSGSLQQRQLNEQDLVVPVKPVSREDLARSMEQADQVLMF